MVPLPVSVLLCPTKTSNCRMRGLRNSFLLPAKPTATKTVRIDTAVAWDRLEGQDSSEKQECRGAPGCTDSNSSSCAAFSGNFLGIFARPVLPSAFALLIPTQFPIRFGRGQWSLRHWTISFGISPYLLSTPVSARMPFPREQTHSSSRSCASGSIIHDKVQFAAAPGQIRLHCGRNGLKLRELSVRRWRSQSMRWKCSQVPFCTGGRWETEG